MVCHGELRNRDEHADKQDDRAYDTLLFESLMKYDGFYEGQKQREGRERNRTDRHGGYLYGLEKSSPVRAHHRSGQDDHDIILLRIQSQSVLFEYRDQKQQDRRADNPSKGDQDCRDLHKLCGDARQSEKHHCNMQV